MQEQLSALVLSLKICSRENREQCPLALALATSFEKTDDQSLMFD
jgi:hypothetical protein